MPPIAWTTEASNDLNDFCRKTEPRTASAATRSQIDDTLTKALPSCCTIIVRRLFVGFRPRSDTQILLVDTGSGTFIAKLGEPGRLDHERQAFAQATYAGFTGDAVFLRLQAVPPTPPLLALQYQTAESNIALPETKSLEDAVLGAIQYQAPTVASVANVLEELLNAIGTVCHRRSGVQTMPSTPTANGIDLLLNCKSKGTRHRLSESLDLWRSRRDAQAIRHDANIAFPIRPDPAIFLDPVAFFDELMADTNSRWLPRVRVGSAHGDLHGRNVIVGLTNNQARRPSLFDYEAMSDESLVAWDFVKLETELKIRVYPSLWPGVGLRRLAWEIGQFERDFGEQTEKHRTHNTWPTISGDSPPERLLYLMLTIRRIASHHLGHDRPGEWLREYYLLLAVYGLHVVRYANQSSELRMGAYVSAGVAASRFEWGLRPTNPQWPWRVLTEIWKLNRNDQNAEALTLAETVQTQLSFDVRARYELAFAQLRCRRHEQAIATLQAAELAAAGRPLDEDCYSLWGNCHKQLGDPHHHLAMTTSDEYIRQTACIHAEREYKQAVQYYERGYQLERTHFPGVNLAHLYVILAAIARQLNSSDSDMLLQKGKHFAQDVISSNGSPGWTKKLSDDTIWFPATLGECHLISEQWSRANIEYGRALAQPDRKHHHVRSMRTQIHRLYVAFRILGIVPQGAIADIERFFPTETKS